MQSRLLALAGFAALAAGALAGCSMSADTKAAEQSVESFHRMLDSGQFDAIYDGSSNAMKNASSHDEFVRFLDAVHRKLGHSGSTKEINWGVFTGVSGERVTLVYKTEYEKGEAQETFVWTFEAGQPKLVGYHINSNALITN